MKYEELEKGIEEELEKYLPIPTQKTLINALNEYKNASEELKNLIDDSDYDLKMEMLRYEEALNEYKNDPEGLENRTDDPDYDLEMLKYEKYNVEAKSLSSLFSPSQLEKGLLQEENGSNTYHYAAENGMLQYIPKEHLTAENLLTTNKEGKTCLHLAAHSENLATLPRLTPKTLLGIRQHFEACLSNPTQDKLPEILNWTTKQLQEAAIYHDRKKREAAEPSMS
jgi:hypothetical protein